ncbi:BnaC05g19200D [Brassica napus]|uniref:BnaC05g19200D protein n=1 Tax=Brassica napus TaxID=3708 RepID=A0A078FQS1_BRANA|nr:BnaC05g19200D [Brassica napus]
MGLKQQQNVNLHLNVH